MKNFTKHFTITALVIALLMLVLQACTDSKGKEAAIPSATEPIPVKVMSLQKSSDTHVIHTSGQITTDDETTLAFKIGGVINTILVKEGDKVKKGQLLATLNLTEINAQVAQAQHSYEKALRDFKRVTNLYADSVATLEQLQNTETALAVAKEQLQAATFNKSFAQIHAPESGYVLRKFVNAGQVVSIGDPILVTNGAASGNWILKVNVSDKQWSAVSLHNTAEVHIDAFTDRTFEAAVTRKSETSDAQTGTFTLELQLKNNGARLATGMFGSAVIKTGNTLSSWSVPYEAVLDANDNEGFVFITADNKTARKQPVRIESFNGTTIRISKGLENAEALIVSGSAYLTDNSPITILK
jgi:RND family efflux transporter MFP subunit